LKGQKGLLPVLFYIHGGAFEVGTGSRPIAGPELLLNKDIVLVTINYRLGPFGNTINNLLHF
jgi:carboxylesterase type B